MTGYYLFFRYWPGFTEPFPFDRFNSLPDDELAKALDAYAREQLHAEKPTIKRIRRKRKRKLGERPPRIEFPWRPPNTGQRQHYDYRVRGTYRRSPLICRVGAYLGWWETSITGIFFGNQITGSRVWLLEVADQDLAEHLVAELNDTQILDLHTCKTAYLLGLNPCFGYVPSEGFSTAERASIQRQINAIRDGQQPGVRGGEASLLLGQRARQVATDAAQAWAQVTSGKTEASNQQEQAENAPIADDPTGESTAQQPVSGDSASEERNKVEPAIEIERWENLGIGIEAGEKKGDRPRYLAVTPCPEYGSVFRKEKSIQLDLPPGQFDILLDLFARSDHGNTAWQDVAMEEFNYLKPGYVPLGGLEALPEDSAQMHTVKQARRSLKQAITNLSRRFREYVAVKDSDSAPPFSLAERAIIRSAFVVRYLLRDDKGKLRFGSVGQTTDG